MRLNFIFLFVTFMMPLACQNINEPNYNNNVLVSECQGGINSIAKTAILDTAELHRFYVNNDTVQYKNIDQCAAAYTFVTTFNAKRDTLFIQQVDTSRLTALCVCVRTVSLIFNKGEADSLKWLSFGTFGRHR
jgi:maltodextrin utilization protein YvdJ